MILTGRWCDSKAARCMEQAASPKHPMPQLLRVSLLLPPYLALASIERGQVPTPEDWRQLSDPINVLERLRYMRLVEDAGGLLEDAIKAMAHAGARHQRGQAIRLDAAGIQMVRAVLEDFAAVLDGLPHRTVIKAYRVTDRHVAAILRENPHPDLVTRVAI